MKIPKGKQLVRRWPTESLPWLSSCGFDFYYVTTHRESDGKFYDVCEVKKRGKANQGGLIEIVPARPDDEGGE